MNVTADAFNSALVHSLWQDTVVGLLLWGALVVLRHSSANARYVVSCAALALMAALPIATTIVFAERGVTGGSSTQAIIIAAPSVDDTLRPAPAQPGDEARSLGWLASLKPWMLPIWLAGVMACSLRLVMAGLHTVALRRRSDPEYGPIAATVATLAARIGVGRSVSVRISMMTDSPATLGFLRPVILLPPAVALGVTPQQLEALLAHELAHIRRHDYLVNVLQMLAETLFFYHPAVWWVSRRIRIERELCCDDIAVNACGDAVGYAQALTRVARLQFARPGMTVGATGGAFLQRIHRLLGVASTTKPVSPLWIAAASVVLIVAVMFTGPYAQSQSPGTLAPVDANNDTVLRGRVVDARSGQPVPGASVRAQYVTGIENPTKCPIGDCEDIQDGDAGRIPMYRATTSADGHFNITDVKAGDYLVAAVAPGYVQRYFGETSNDMPEMSVHVAAGQRTASIDVRLEPAGAVMGHVFSERGEGLAGVEVELLRRTYLPGGAQPIPVAFAQTEEMGAFTFRNVIAGEYYVRAYVQESPRPKQGDTSLSYVATLFPNATDITFAQPIVVASGQELPGVDFALVTARTRVVSGRLSRSRRRVCLNGHGSVDAQVGGARRAQCPGDGERQFPVRQCPRRRVHARRLRHQPRAKLEHGCTRSRNLRRRHRPGTRRGSESLDRRPHRAGGWPAAALRLDVNCRSSQNRESAISARTAPGSRRWALTARSRWKAAQARSPCASSGCHRAGSSRRCNWTVSTSQTKYSNWGLLPGAVSTSR